jgi:dipeptidyl aminopeptidase/acylaminoacyl peptidase
VRVAPYGSWESTVRIEDLAGTPPLGTPKAAKEGLYWTETRPDEGGRSVLVWCERGGDPVTITPGGFDVRTRVHEYGGGAFWLAGPRIFFSHFEDGRLYRQDGPDADPVPITPEPSEPNALRYADGRITPDELVVCVRESHENGDVVNELVVFPVGGSEPPRTLVSGNDFYAAPRASPDGSRLVWLTWNHPELPFTGTELWVGDLAGGHVRDARRVAGGPEESVFQPDWSPAGRLLWVSDRTGWWNLYREGENLTPIEAEFGLPAWSFDMARYAFLADGRIACAVVRRGVTSLELLDPETGALDVLALPYTTYGTTLSAYGDRIAVVASGPRAASALVEIDSATGDLHVYKQLPGLVDDDSISEPVALEFPSEDGARAHAFLYRAQNTSFRAPDGELPPLLVFVHGGPTALSPPGLWPDFQFWTTRGFAVLDLNYGGSTGYGRAYRERLDGQWGVVDVVDAAAAARYAVEQGEADNDRVAIIGGSAGGYTTLMAVALRQEFAAGVNYYGVVDLETFVADTHKFESRYLDLLVGPYPERADLYRERSPITHADRIRASLLTFQGLDDHIVPPSQSEQLVDALKRHGVPHAYIAFEGEGHGFRRRESIERATQASLAFLGRVFDFEPADDLPPLELD